MDDHFIPAFCQQMSEKEAEIQACAEEIIARERRKQEATTLPDLTVPIVSLGNCTAEEQSIVRAALSQRVQRALKCAETEAIGEITPATVEHVQIRIPEPLVTASTVRDLAQLLGHKPPAFVGNKDSPIGLMHLLLHRAYLRRYNNVFYYFDNGIYRRIDDIKTFVFAMIEPELSSGRTPQLLRNVVELLCAYPRIQAFQADLGPTNLPFVNGILDLNTWQFRHVEPSDFFLNYIAVPFVNPAPPCPVFDHFLETISGGDPDIISAIKEMIGYLLTPDMAGKCFFVLQGVGDTGKSVLANLISSFFNVEAVAHLDISRLGDRFSPAALQGKWLNVCADLPDGRLKKEAVGAIKQIMGNDTISVEAKFRAVTSFKPTCKLLFATNFPLRMEHDEAFLSRCAIIPFSHPIPKDKQDKQLLQKMLMEAPGIIVQCLEAYRRLRARNYQFLPLAGALGITGCISYPELFDGFLATQCAFIPGAFTPTVALFSAFNDYCKLQGGYELPDMVQFSRQLNNYCAGRIKPKRKRCSSGNLNGYEGIVVSPPKGEYIYGN